MPNYVFIAASLDGFIAKTNGSLDWLDRIENPDHDDFGYDEFLKKIDAIVMGRGTYDFVKNISPWPYKKPVYVLSRSLSPQTLPNQITITDRSPLDLQQELNRMGYRNLYVDGGKTIHSFMRENLIDEWTITRIPIMLGAGIPLFDNTLEKETSLVHIATRVFSNGLVQSTYKKQ